MCMRNILIYVLKFANINLILYFCIIVYKSNLGFTLQKIDKNERSHTSNHETNGYESETIC